MVDVIIAMTAEVMTIMMTVVTMTMMVAMETAMLVRTVMTIAMEMEWHVSLLYECCPLRRVACLCDAVRDATLYGVFFHLFPCDHFGKRAERGVKKYFSGVWALP